MDIRQRNLSALEQANKSLTEKVFELEKRLTAALAAVGALETRVASLETGAALQRASSFGHGPSVR